MRVAAAANLQYTIREISSVFQEETGIQVDIIIGSSGKLTAQIEQGAPFDVFVAADMKYPGALYEKGYAETPPETYAHGRLVLWSMDTTRQLPCLTQKRRLTEKRWCMHLEN